MLQSLSNKNIVTEFHKRHAKSISDAICHYAASDPFEAVACDLSKRVIGSINKETLLPRTNIFNKKPYNNRLFLSKDKDTAIEKLLRKYWNGNI